MNLLFCPVCNGKWINEENFKCEKCGIDMKEIKEALDWDEPLKEPLFGEYPTEDE